MFGKDAGDDLTTEIVACPSEVERPVGELDALTRRKESGSGVLKEGESISNLLCLLLLLFQVLLLLHIIGERRP